MACRQLAISTSKLLNAFWQPQEHLSEEKVRGKT